MPITKRKSTRNYSPGVRPSHLRNAFGALEVPHGMRSVSSYRQSDRPFAIMPFGPPQRWIEEPPEAAASSAFGLRRYLMNKFGENLRDKYVNPSGYLSTWYGQPKVLPASWNPLLLQGNNVFTEGIDNPNLSQVVPSSWSNSFSNRRKVARRKVTRRKKTSEFGKKRKVTRRKKTLDSEFGKKRKVTRRKKILDSEFGKKKVTRRRYQTLGTEFGKKKVTRKKTATNKNAKTSKGWSAYSKKINRKTLPSNCFLEPKRKAYPYCDKKGKVDCRGLLAAKQRAVLGKKRKLAKKAEALGRKYSCAWAM
jgi:hypothetical protein